MCLLYLPNKQLYCSVTGIGTHEKKERKTNYVCVCVCVCELTVVDVCVCHSIGKERRILMVGLGCSLPAPLCLGRMHGQIPAFQHCRESGMTVSMIQ